MKYKFLTIIILGFSLIGFGQMGQSETEKQNILNNLSKVIKTSKIESIFIAEDIDDSISFISASMITLNGDTILFLIKNKNYENLKFYTKEEPTPEFSYPKNPQKKVEELKIEYPTMKVSYEEGSGSIYVMSDFFESDENFNYYTKNYLVLIEERVVKQNSNNRKGGSTDYSRYKSVQETTDCLQTNYPNSKVVYEERTGIIYVMSDCYFEENYKYYQNNFLVLIEERTRLTQDTVYRNLGGSIVINISDSVFKNHSDTLYFSSNFCEKKYKSDTTFIKMEYKSSKNYIKFGEGIYVRQGYGSDRIVGYFDDVNLIEKYYIKEKNKYVEIDGNNILKQWKTNKL
jgi:hypothetical protein